MRTTLYICCNSQCLRDTMRKIKDVLIYYDQHANILSTEYEKFIFITSSDIRNKIKGYRIDEVRYSCPETIKHLSNESKDIVKTFLRKYQYQYYNDINGILLNGM